MEKFSISVSLLPYSQVVGTEKMAAQLQVENSGEGGDVMTSDAQHHEKPN